MSWLVNARIDPDNQADEKSESSEDFINLCQEMEDDGKGGVCLTNSKEHRDTYMTFGSNKMGELGVDIDLRELRKLPKEITHIRVLRYW